MRAPFEGLFGNTSELKVVQFLLPLRSLEFNISEIARGTGITRQTIEPVIKKLAKWHVLEVTSKHGNATYYALDGNSGFIEAFENLNNCVIEQLLGEEVLAGIENYSFESQIQIQSIDLSSYVKVSTWSAAASGSEEKWSHMIKEGGDAFVAA